MLCDGTIQNLPLYERRAARVWLCVFVYVRNEDQNNKNYGRIFFFLTFFLSFRIHQKFACLYNYSLFVYALYFPEPYCSRCHLCCRYQVKCGELWHGDCECGRASSLEPTEVKSRQTGTKAGLVGKRQARMCGTRCYNPLRYIRNQAA